MRHIAHSLSLTCDLSCWQAGGLSGQPLMGLATEVLRDMYVLTKGKMPIIGVGGVATAEDAYAKIRAGMAIFILPHKICARELEALYHTFSA